MIFAHPRDFIVVISAVPSAPRHDDIVFFAGNGWAIVPKFRHRWVRWTSSFLASTPAFSVENAVAPVVFLAIGVRQVAVRVQVGPATKFSACAAARVFVAKLETVRLVALALFLQGEASIPGLSIEQTVERDLNYE